jgi:hypothetical protein
MDALEQQRLAMLQPPAAQPTTRGTTLRQPAQGTRLYAAPDALHYCTTERAPRTRKLLWRELRAAADYEVAPASADPPSPPPGMGVPADRLPLRRRVQAWATTQLTGWTLAPVDQAVRVTYVARTEPSARFGEFLDRNHGHSSVTSRARELSRKDEVAPGSPCC